MKFLVVDDEHDVETLFRQRFRREIRSGKVELVFAFSGQEALEIIKSTNPPDIVYIFSDINMPGMSGFELLERVKSDYPHIHVSMISAYGDTENYQKAKEIGAKEFFTKPIDFKNLREELHDVLEDNE
ncbi:response regulator [Rhodohalobacter sulfatireducens]|uniref:Response regulator n=1 Tax=Rhodohalobacter sulfatireducens TaxID=2911366 RepID=A0ABS9K9S9_9BACT|nr:response regulator [Rhodohalobacter sulfatireducens]MCG2587601.1 response regulator [Rhodohalobacter sulfatireducens]